MVLYSYDIVQDFSLSTLAQTRFFFRTFGFHSRVWFLQLFHPGRWARFNFFSARVGLKASVYDASSRIKIWRIASDTSNTLLLLLRQKSFGGQAWVITSRRALEAVRYCFWKSEIRARYAKTWLIRARLPSRSRLLDLTFFMSSKLVLAETRRAPGLDVVIRFH